MRHARDPTAETGRLAVLGIPGVYSFPGSDRGAHALMVFLDEARAAWRGSWRGRAVAEGVEHIGERGEVLVHSGDRAAQGARERSFDMLRELGRMLRERVQ